MKMSKHFIENWEKRVGNTPSIPMIKDIISKSVRVQKFKKYFLANKGIFVRLAVYWCPELNIIITLDQSTHKLVSVLTPDAVKELKDGTEPMSILRTER